ncbi:MAG: protein-glutamate O-methyltransferase CheR [Polyangiales bacterium]
MIAVACKVGSELSLSQFERLREVVRAHSGIALRVDQLEMVSSRLSRRLRMLALQSFDDYFGLLQGAGGDELQHLLNTFTTNKTSFFREAHHFEELRARVLQPKLRCTASPHLRIWSAGCSTGEEPYSVVATLLQAISEWERADIKVLASDIDTQVLQTAERAVYRAEKGEELPPEIARRWFVRGTGEKSGFLRARRELRERVSFRRINFIDPQWPVRARFDAIFCRNALIYFDLPVQRQIVARLLTYLAPGGLLLLGHSEAMAGTRPDLRSLGRTTYLYLGDGG